MRYCTECATELMRAKRGDDEDVACCPACGKAHYESFRTAVLVAAVSGGRVILLRQAYVSTTNWVLVAGFVSQGETAEEAAARETAEETGLSITACHYIRSYYHERRNLLILGFVADVADRPFGRSAEVDDIRWAPLAEAMGLLRPGSIGQRLLGEVIDALGGS